MLGYPPAAISREEATGGLVPLNLLPVLRQPVPHMDWGLQSRLMLKANGLCEFSRR